MHAENGIAIDVLIAPVAGSGDDRPDFTMASPGHELLRAEATHRADLNGPRWPAPCRARSSTCRLARPWRRSRAGPPPWSATCSPRPARRIRVSRRPSRCARPGFEGAKFARLHAVAHSARAYHAASGRACGRRAGGRRHRPPSVPLEGTEGALPAATSPHIQRVRRRRKTAWTCIYQGVVTGALSPRTLALIVVTTPAQDVSGSTCARGSLAPGPTPTSSSTTWTGRPDRRRHRQHHTNIDYRAYEGFEVDGNVDMRASAGATYDVDGRHGRRTCNGRSASTSNGPAPAPGVNDRLVGVQDRRVVVSADTDGKRARGIGVHRIGSTEKASRGTRAVRAGVNPATGEQASVATSRSSTKSTPPGAVARQAVPTWKTTSLARAGQGFRYRELIERTTARRSPRCSPPNTAKAPPTPSARSTAAWRWSSSPAGIPHLLRAAIRSRQRRESTPDSTANPSGSSPATTPLNFPAMVPMWMSRRPCLRQDVRAEAEREGFVGRRCPLAELLGAAGLPAGSAQRHPRRQGGGRPAAIHLTSRRVSFVGSTPIARYIYETGTKHGKRVQALGGAKNHMLVLPDADLDMAADAAAHSFLSAMIIVMQVCNASSRLRMSILGYEIVNSFIVNLASASAGTNILTLVLFFSSISFSNSKPPI